VNEEHLKKKRYQEICSVYSTRARFSVSSFSAHKNLRVRIQTEKTGVNNRLYRHHLNPQGLL